MYEGSSENNSKTIIVLFVSIIAIISTVSVLFIFSSNNFFFLEDTSNSIHTTVNNTTIMPTYTTSYTNISVDDAYMNWFNNESIYFIDVRPCACSYKDKHIIDANLTSHFSNGLETLFNTTSDIVFYDWTNDVKRVSDYCETMVNNTYGGIFYLQDGYNAWKKAGYPTE